VCVCVCVLYHLVVRRSDTPAHKRSASLQSPYVVHALPVLFWVDLSGVHENVSGVVHTRVSGCTHLLVLSVSAFVR
jgi:hypothetical protein